MGTKALSFICHQLKLKPGKRKDFQIFESLNGDPWKNFSQTLLSCGVLGVNSIFSFGTHDLHFQRNLVCLCWTSKNFKRSQIRFQKLPLLHLPGVSRESNQFLYYISRWWGSTRIWEPAAIQHLNYKSRLIFLPFEPGKKMVAI